MVELAFKMGHTSKTNCANSRRLLSKFKRLFISGKPKNIAPFFDSIDNVMWYIGLGWDIWCLSKSGKTTKWSLCIIHKNDLKYPSDMLKRVGHINDIRQMFY